jgi:hypothetical protein
MENLKLARLPIPPHPRGDSSDETQGESQPLEPVNGTTGGLLDAPR